MSRSGSILAIVLLAGALVPVAGTAARADVLEVGGSGASWVAGGPRQISAEFAPKQQEMTTDAPLTQVLAHAGPAYWQGEVALLAEKYDISPRLLEAVVWQESRWNPQAVSSAGARGLTQLMPGTARDLGVDSRDPRANLEGGARYLRMQLDMFDGNVEKALAAYNAGPLRVIKAGGIPNIRETKGYVAAIMSRLSDPVRR